MQAYDEDNDTMHEVDYIDFAMLPGDMTFEELITPNLYEQLKDIEQSQAAFAIIYLEELQNRAGVPIIMHDRQIGDDYMIWHCTDGTTLHFADPVWSDTWEDTIEDPAYEAALDRFDEWAVKK